MNQSLTIMNHYKLWLSLWTIIIMNQSSITGWWFESLWKILVNGKNDIPYIMENKKCSKPPTIDIWLIIDSLIILIVTWEISSHYEPINQIMNIEKLIVSRWHPLRLWTNQPDYEPFWFSSLPANNFRILQRQEFHRRANLIHEVGRHPSQQKAVKTAGWKARLYPIA